MLRTADRDPRDRGPVPSEARGAWLPGSAAGGSAPDSGRGELDSDDMDEGVTYSAPCALAK
jgi:hypothetical protein